MSKPFEKGAFDYDHNAERLLPSPPKPETIESYWRDEGRVLPRMAKEDLVKFVEEYVDGSKIFTSADIPDKQQAQMLPMVFLPLAIGALAKWEEEDFKQIGLFWAYYHEAGPRSINGYPCFFSMRMMHIEDWEKARTAINNELLRRKERGKSIADDL